MADPSFDDLLDSLDAIQAEHPVPTSASYYDEPPSSKKSYERYDEELSLPPPPPAPAKTHHVPKSSPSSFSSGPSYSSSSSPSSYSSSSPSSDFSSSSASSYSSKPYQASKVQAPPQNFSSASQRSNPGFSKQGDVTEYQKQPVVIPSSSSSRAAPSGGDSHCFKCGGSLYGTEYVNAGGKAYHQDHFVCSKCNTRLVGAYYDHHSQIYCPNCAGELMPCTKCRRGITGQYMILEGKPFHNECVERKYCAKCNKQIDDTVLTALGQPWHQRCFTCFQCGRELGTQFVTKDGQGQCEDCSRKGRPACEKCHNPLSGEYINFQGKSYHQDCFVCSQCRDRLGTAGFFNVNGSLKCGRCAGR